MRLWETLRYPQELERALPRLIGVFVGLLVSVVVAYWVGTQQLALLGLVVSLTVTIFVATKMRDRAWVLIPLGWALTGTIPLLPLNFSVRNACTLLAFCSFVMYAIVAQKNFRRKFNTLDIILALNLVWLVFTFVHHPVGLLILGGERIGGRPYVEIFLAVLAYWVLTRAPNSPKMVSRIPWFILFGTIAVAAINLIVYVAPALTPIIFFIYRGIDVGGYIALGVAEPTSEGRWVQMAPFGYTLVLLLCASKEPRILLNPLRPWFYALLLGFAAVLASGFRSTLLATMAAFAIGASCHRGWRELLLGALLGSVLLGAVLVGQGRVFHLPDPAQRSLSWLPGKWSPTVVAGAEQSSEMRFKWWQNVIKYDLIHDWWLGDGFGVSASDLTLFLSSRDFYSWMTLVGGFHNGPLTAIRYAGIVGLIFFYILMIAAAAYSIRCVNRCRGTPFQTLAIFLAAQLIWEPVQFALVFGSYDMQVPETIFLIALLLLVMRMSEVHNGHNSPRLHEAENYRRSASKAT